MVKITKANAYISRGKARRILGQVFTMAQSAEQGFQRLAEEHHEQTLRKFVEAYRQESPRRYGYGRTLGVSPPKPSEIETAIRSGILAPKPFDVSLDEMALDHQVNRILSHNRQANDSSGHRYNVCRDRAKPRKRGRAGRGFSYKPEIASLPGGNGELVPSGSNYQELDDELFMPRYSRGKHPDQSMPKIEWQIVRRWGNRKKRCRKKVAMAAKDIRERLEAQQAWINEYIAKHGRID